MYSIYAHSECLSENIKETDVTCCSLLQDHLSNDINSLRNYDTGGFKKHYFFLKDLLSEVKNEG